MIIWSYPIDILVVAAIGLIGGFALGLMVGERWHPGSSKGKSGAEIKEHLDKCFNVPSWVLAMREELKRKMDE